MRAFRTALSAVVIAAASATFAQQIQATVNGTPVFFSDVQPMMVNSRVMVPLRGVFEQMSADVDWVAATQTVTAKTQDRTVVLRVGDPVATINGRTVTMDTPAVLYRNRTLVPLRFLGESLGAEVAWIEASRTVAITTDPNAGGGAEDPKPAVVLEANTVIPLRLNQELRSDGSAIGDRFTANVNPADGRDYLGLPAGTIVEGHVSVVRAKTSESPGVLGLDFDKIVLPNGRSYTVDGSLVGLDEKSVTNENGKLVAKDTRRDKDTLKWVGIGAGGGALVAILTKGNLLTDALIGGALGWLFSEIQKNPSQSNNVQLNAGSQFGMRIDTPLTIRDIAR